MDVAVAVIVDKNNRVLLTKRPLHKPHGGLWEFPGGKIEENESAAVALIREIKEEVDLTIKGFDYLATFNHEYPKQQVNLFVYIVTDFEGKPSCRESQVDMKWVNIGALQGYDFPEANVKIVEKINETKGLGQRRIHVNNWVSNSAATPKNQSCFFHLDPLYKEDPEFVLNVLLKEPEIIKSLSNKLLYNQTFLLKAVKKAPEVIKHLRQPLYRDKAFMLKAVNTAPILIKFLPTRYQTKEIAEQSIKKDPSLIEFVSEKFKKIILASEENESSLQVLL